jgi:hypothetical protein
MFLTELVFALKLDRSTHQMLLGREELLGRDLYSYFLRFVPGYSLSIFFLHQTSLRSVGAISTNRTNDDANQKTLPPF